MVRWIAIGSCWMVLVGLGSRPAAAACAGDCAGDGTVVVNELVVGVNMALGNTPVQQCPGFDVNADGRVAVNELVAAVANALGGCPFTGRYTGRVDVGDGETATVQVLAGPNGEANGSLTVGASTAVGRAALRLDIPGVSLIGTVDLDTGDYHLTGIVAGPNGPVPVDVSGTLPVHADDIGTLRLEIGDDSFDGTLVAGDGQPTPTPTLAVPTPTPTATGIPASVPTPGASCAQGAIGVAASDLSGTNSYTDLAAGFGLGKLMARQSQPGIFGGSAVPCSVSAGDVIRKVDFGIFALGESLTVGTPYPLETGSGLRSYVSYLELPSSNPLGARGWKAHGGAVIFDAIDGDTARLRIVGAVMVAEPSFSAQQPATGTFTLNAGVVATHIHDQ